LQRIKEREAKIGELRKEIYDQDHIIRELSRRSKAENHGRKDPAGPRSLFVY
jgi:hypothetical protein